MGPCVACFNEKSKALVTHKVDSLAKWFKASTHCTRAFTVSRSSGSDDVTTSDELHPRLDGSVNRTLRATHTSLSSDRKRRKYSPSMQPRWGHPQTASFAWLSVQWSQLQRQRGSVQLSATNHSQLVSDGQRSFVMIELRARVRQASESGGGHTETKHSRCRRTTVTISEPKLS